MSQPSVCSNAEQAEVYLILYIGPMVVSCLLYQNTPVEQVKLYLAVQLSLQTALINKLNMGSKCVLVFPVQK